MAFGAEPHFSPRQFTRSAALTTTPEVIFAAGARKRVRVSHIEVRSAAGANRIITFQGAGGGPIVVTVSLVTITSIVIPGWAVDANGLEVLTSSGTGQQNAIFHYTLGPLGAS